MKPQFLVEVEQHTGLTSEPDIISGEYWMLGPSGVRLFKVMGDGHTIGGISMPEMYALQGISKEVRHARRRQDSQL